ncbi:gas vesicle protein GvpO [Kribbella karoonensis]|uniref:Gas vesicle protein GvpO n=1 Tax=Kribbella karoonensis TaxID=324851 RepID=A0ABN2CY57_9ACTN
MAAPRKSTTPRKTAAKKSATHSSAAQKRSAAKSTGAENTEAKSTEAKSTAAKSTAARKAPAKARPAAAAPSRDGARLRDVVLRSTGELAELIGLQPEGVVAVELDGDGGDDRQWRVQVEVVESHRIPETTDILAIYELVAGSNGELLSYRRLSRYVRGRFEE